MEDKLEDVVKTGDYRASLVALRDYVAHELEVHRCSACQAFQLRTGDTAALVLRLQKVMEEIESIPAVTKEVSRLDQLRARRDGKSTSKDSGSAKRASDR